MYKVRRRLINFRVTDEELERLKTAAAQQGSRCLSDFARFVMLGSADAQCGPAGGGMETTLLQFDRRLSVLEANVARIVTSSPEPNGSATQKK